MGSIRYRMVRSGVIRLAAYERGDAAAPTVLLVHGYPDCHSVWDEVADRLAERFHVVSYDVRGAGLSDAPRPRAAYRLGWLARDLRAVAREFSPRRRVHLVGHDWGSIQGWEPVTEPGAQRWLASYTSISGPCLDHVGYWFRERCAKPTPLAVRQALHQLLRSWYVAALHLPGAAPAAWRLVLARRWGAFLERAEELPPGNDHPAPTLTQDAVRGIQLYRANILPRVLRPRPRHARVPVQTISPTRDNYVLPAFTEGLARWVPDLRRREIAAPHWVPLTHPDDVARMITEHVDQVGA